VIAEISPYPPSPLSPSEMEKGGGGTVAHYGDQAGIAVGWPLTVTSHWGVQPMPNTLR
jgi:hypothetical protein